VAVLSLTRWEDVGQYQLSGNAIIFYFLKLNMLVEIIEQLYLFMLFSTILTLAESYRVV